MKNFGNVIWGLAFIIVGVIFGLNALGITNINIFFPGWWTLFIIIPCLVGFIKNSNKTGNLIGIAIGILLLLCAQNIITYALLWKLFIPLVLVVIGLSIIFSSSINSKINGKIKELNKSNGEEYCATFGEQKVDLQNEQVKNCSLSAVFGSVEYDAKEGIVNQDTVINASSIFGGVEITVPSGVSVKVKSTPIFGGVENKVKNKKDAENVPTIYVNAFCLFGGVTIK